MNIVPDKIKQDYCDCCLSGGKQLKRVKLHNTTENGFCDCVVFVCNDCLAKKKLFEEFLENQSLNCENKTETSCGCLEFKQLQQEIERQKHKEKIEKLKNKFGFLVYLIPVLCAFASIIVINNHFRADLYASIVFIISLAICHFIYKKI